MARPSRKKIQPLRRRVNLRERKRIILIICEGEKTEIIYFQDLNLNKGRESGIRIIPINKKGVDAVGLVDYARSIMVEYDVDVRNGDQVWCVFDVDDKSNDELRLAFDSANRNRINVGLSNPSFEVWYLLHYAMTTACMNNTELIRRLSHYIAGYSKNESVFGEIHPNVIRAQ